MRRHPLAVPAVVLSVSGFLPLVIVGGVLGALLGAVAGAASRRHPERWAPPSTADAGVAIGALTGLMPLALFGAVKMDDWGPGPLIAAVVLTAAVGAIAVGGALDARRAAAGAAVGVAAVGGTTLVAVGLALAVVWFLVLMVNLLWDAITS